MQYVKPQKYREIGELYDKATGMEPSRQDAVWQLLTTLITSEQLKQWWEQWWEQWQPPKLAEVFSRVEGEAAMGGEETVFPRNASYQRVAVSAPAGHHAHSHAPLQQGGRGAGRSCLLLHRQGLPLCCLCFSRAAAALPVSQRRIRQRPTAVHPAAISQAVLQARRGAVFPDCRTLPARAVESLRFW